MHGQLSNELEVGVPAAHVWELYSTLKLAQLIKERLPYMVEKIHVVEGDGGVGTILHVTLPPGSYQYNRKVMIVNTGTVLQVGDGIACIHGLDEVMAGELVDFEEGTIGIVLNLESNNVGIVLMGDGLMIQEGSSVKATTGRIAQIPVSEAYLGRVINVLAKPIDGRGEISASESRLIESPAPGMPFGFYKEKFVEIDNENRVKVVELIEGGYLDMGFRLYRLRLEILEKDCGTSIIRSTTEYEIDEEFAANETLVSNQALEVIAEAAAKFLLEKKAEVCNA